jgi:hypothetical protein
MTPAPRSTLRWALRTGWPFAVAILAGGVPFGCYKPNIKDGGLRCNLDAGGGKSCPEGFRCDTSRAPPTCWRNSDGGVDRPSSDGPDARVDVPIEKPPTVCFDARPNCTATDAAVCDPFCQSGCGCLEKCSINTAGAATCNPLAPGQMRGVQEPCEAQSSGTAQQIDQCRPGLVCVEDACGSGSANGRCYQFCRADNDCVDAPCNRDAGGGFKYCDVPFVGCTPLPVPNNTGCPAPSLICYIATSDVSRQICDCQFPPGLGADDVCTRSRECNAGLVCVANQLGTKVCTRVCRLTGNDCPVGTCRTLTENGKTNPTFGFCRL